jgi:hypothetical protein
MSSSRHPPCCPSASGPSAAAVTLRIIAAAIVLATAAACTVLYAWNSDEENLACGPDDGSPRCLQGYTCVPADDGIERCVKAGFKTLGEPCRASTECADDGICADAWATRCDDPTHRMSCALLDENDRGLRCRAPCKNALPACASGTRCFDGPDDGDVPFCQQGACAADSDCVGGGEAGLCLEEAFSGGRSGLCSPVCAPLRCFDRGEDCPCLPTESCATPVDEGVSNRAVCTPTGVIGENQTCDDANPCADGLTCVLLSNNVHVCQRWCAVGGGAPACTSGVCNGVPGDPFLGLCQ